MKAAASDEQKAAARKQEVLSLTRRGMPGKAVRHAVSLGLAADTEEVEKIMRSKFVQPPASQATSARIPAPQANDLTETGVARAIHSFNRGVSAGPPRQRPDFYKQLIGEKNDKPGLGILTGICTLLANGLAPRQLAPYIGGARGTALYKKAKDGSDDARPACSGGAIRRTVGKALLPTEMDNLRDHLCPHHLAVGIRAGVEAMPHLARQWTADYKGDGDRILINSDESNAHNEVDRHTFLTRMREVAPGMAKWLEYIYPTDQPTYVYYRGRVIESRAGGQQGCPAIGACHAVTKKMLHGALGLIPPSEGSSIQLPVLDPPAVLDMAPNFADDGLLARKSGEVLRALTHLKRVMPMVGLKFSTLQLVPAALDAHTFQVEPFTALGGQMCSEGNVEILKSPVGTQEFCQQYCLQQVGKQRALFEFLAELGDPQIIHNLLKWSVNAGRMNYMARTTPAAACADAMAAFDVAVTDTLAATVGQQWSERQVQQVSFATRQGGLGLGRPTEMRDAAYKGSRAATQALCVAIRPEHRWEIEEDGQPLNEAAVQARRMANDLTLLDGEIIKLTQQYIGSAIRKYAARRWRDAGTPADRAIHNAYSAKGAGKF